MAEKQIIHDHPKIEEESFEISVDCMVLRFEEGNLEVLLTKYEEGNGVTKWGLLSGGVRREECTHDAAHRLLQDYGVFDKIFLEQSSTFGNPNRFPLRRVISIGYFALTNRENYILNNGCSSSYSKWCKTDDIPDLIYDHNEILAVSLKQLRTRFCEPPVAFNLLPEKFTLLELQDLYEQILGVTVDKSNFRRKILSKELLIPTEKKQQNVDHRAAKLYRFDRNAYQKLAEKGFSLVF